MNDPTPQQPDRPRRRPLQFGIGTLLLAALALSLLFGTLKALGIPPLGLVIVMGVLVVSVVAALGLVLVIARTMTGEPEEQNADGPGQHGPNPPESPGTDDRRSAT